MIIKEYEIHNLDCAGCSAKIEASIANLAEVSEVNLDFMNKRLIVQYKNESAEALERLNAIASRIEPGVSIHEPDDHDHVHDVGGKYSYIIFAGLLLYLISIFLPVSPLVKHIIAIISYLMVSGRVLRDALKEVFTRQLLAEHFLMSIASIGALYLGEYSEAIAVMALYELGQYLESRALSGSRKSVNSLLSLKPEKAHRKKDNGEIEEIRLNELKLDDTILVYAGERIPVDGIIRKGESSLDASSISGESEALAVSEGDYIYAGTLNNSGLLEMEVKKTEAESMVSRITQLIESAGARKSQQERFITRFARYYTPAVVVLAFLVFLIPTLLGYPAASWFKRALVFLIVSCPCALVISIPLSYYIGIGIAAKRGIIFKGSSFLDHLRKIQTIVYDKTGTLTTGDLRLEKIITVGDTSAADFEAGLFICEYTSNHPYALAVKKELDLPFDTGKVESFTEIPGKGITIRYDGNDYTAGSEALFNELGYLNLIDAGTSSAVHLSINALYQGVALFSDEIKPLMPEVLSNLKDYGVKRQIMLSGDRRAKAEAVANELGLDAFYAELLPQDKLDKLEEVMAENPDTTCFVGDGLNDAPVLARADIGIAMGGIGAQATIESGDIILLNDKAEQLQKAFEISRQTNRIVWQNIGLALGIKILVMALGVSGISGLWEAIIADVGVSLMVIFNSLRLLKIR